jgi:hypothetical protein
MTDRSMDKNKQVLLAPTPRRPSTPSRATDTESAPLHQPPVAPQHLLGLQRNIGNRAVLRLIAGSPAEASEISVSRSLEPIVARDDAPEVEAPAYVETFSSQIGDGVRDFLSQQDFPMPEALLSWADPKSFSRDAVAAAGSGGAALTTRLPDLLRPSDLHALVNKARKMGTVQVTNGNKTWIEEQTGQGPATWFPDVAVEVGEILAERLTEALARMVPRYLEARVAAGVQAEKTQRVSLLEAPEPAGPLLTSHPADPLAAAALQVGTVRFDWPKYHLANPDAVGKVQVPRQVTYSIEKPQNGTYWVRVTSPADPIPEEVALALFGDTRASDYIEVSAPPLFGFGDPRPMRPDVLARFTAVGIDTSRIGDPAAEGTSSPLADEIALGQAKAVPGAAKQDVLGTMGESLIVLDKIIEIGAAFGIGKDPTLGDVGPIKEKLTKKRDELTAADDATAAKWSGQATAQRSVLTQVSFGFAGLVERLQAMTKNVTDATAKLGGFTLPPYVRDILHDAAMRYVDAGSSSFFPQVAEQKLAAAERSNRLAPVRIFEATLSAVQRTVDDALKAKREENSQHEAYDVEGMEQREVALRARLANVRLILLRDPSSAGELLAKLQEEILDLQTEAEIVANMDQLDAAWQALDDSNSSWFTSTGTSAQIRALQSEGDQWHARWKAIFDLWKKGDKVSRDKAKSDLDLLRKDEKLGDYFGRLKALVKSAQTEMLVGKIVAMLVITIVTAGVGEFVAGAALGAELSAGATLVAVGGAEALTFTALSQIMLDTNHSAGHIAYELATNFAMFAAMRRFAAFSEAAKLGTFTASTGQAVLLGAMGLAKEEIAKLVTTGKHLTRDEIGQIALQSLVMFVALNGVGRLAQPILAEVKAGGEMFTLRRNAANRAAGGLKEMQAGLAGSKDPAKALEYIEAERKWLDLKMKTYEALETAAKAEARGAKDGKPPKGGVLEQAGMSMEDIASMKSTLGQHAQKMGAARTMLTLEPIAPDTYTAPRSRIAEALKELSDPKLVKTDADGVRTYEVKSPDGRRVTITETLDTYERFLVELQKELSDPEAAKLAKMTGNKSPQEVHDMFGGDKEAAVKKIRSEVAAEASRLGTKAASKDRMEALRLKIADEKIMQDPEISALIEGLTKENKGETVSILRDKVMARILADEALARVQAIGLTAEVLTGVKIFELQPEATIEQWKSNHPAEKAQGLTLRPDPAGGPDGLYWQRGEIDVMVVVPQAGGKSRVMHREEIKTGTTDKPVRAKEQLDEIGRLLAQGGSGKIRLELPDKTDITGRIDTGSDASATKATRGPSDKKVKTSPSETEGFDASLGITSTDLERLVKTLITEETAAPKAPSGDKK